MESEEQAPAEGIPKILERAKAGRPKKHEAHARAMAQVRIANALEKIARDMQGLVTAANQALLAAMKSGDHKAAVAAARVVYEYVKPRGPMVAVQVNNDREAPQKTSHLNLPAVAFHVERLAVKGREKPRTPEILPELVLPEKRGGRDYGDGFKALGPRPEMGLPEERPYRGREGIREAQQSGEVLQPEQYPPVTAITLVGK